MNAELEIKLLVDCKEHIPLLAELWFNELGKQWIPNTSVERAKQTYETHTNRNKLPLTYVALDENKPIAMASLRDNDGIRDDLTPWLGSLIVHPDYRRQGIGEILIELTKQHAKRLGYKKLYLFALDPTIPTWYTKLDFKEIGTDKLYHHPVTVMEINL